MSAFEIIGNLVIAAVGGILVAEVLFVILILEWTPKNPKNWPAIHEWIEEQAPHAPRGTVVPYIVTPNGIRVELEPEWMDDGLTPEWNWPVR